MCGINGCIPPSLKIHEMNKALHHRGPDGVGVFSNTVLSLGHTRLKILDLTDNAAQPMGLKASTTLAQDRLEDADYILTFNGEIYNFKELQEELKITKTLTSGDTEILLHAYKKWGKDCVKKFNGMWAFAIYDKKKNSLFLSRDRLGQKPLYYYYDKNSFAFSSELKGLRALDKSFKINSEAVRLYFSLGFIPSPHSIFDKVYKLNPGHSLHVDIATLKITKEKYFSVSKMENFLTPKETIRHYHELMSSSVESRLVADVPVGAFLSGGIDSSSVVAFVSKKSKMHTFSIGFEEKSFDETPFIMQVKNKFKTKHHHTTYTRKDFESNIQTYMDCFDEPLADYSCFPTLAVAKLARKNVTVALSGDGGDEIFGGYTRHILGKQMEFLRKLPRFLRKAVASLSLKKQVRLGSLSTFVEACRVSLLPKEQFMAASFLDDLYKPEVYQKWSSTNLKYCLSLSNNNLSEALRLFDLQYHTLGDNFLAKVDRASMHYSLEVRSPYLDYRFIALAQQIAPNQKTSFFSGKKILKRALRTILPSSIIQRKKVGFTPPIDVWIQKDFSKEILESTLKHLQDFPDIVSFYQDKALKRNTSAYRIYVMRLFLFGKWLERWNPTS
jgi:asparagine synthase (glutamine-hydrolysing)